ncbi:unnamed protein product [Dracunculus medinensis]|uniref:Small ribosomal subunit protein eS4 n=1 Tax=Dracunculus medinensis TaxID=318479 RepID=A0A0N4ULP0_DRAME|nr:unnamed protein product [Dracunculus medinensis]
MARGPKRHLKRLAAPHHWMLDKLGGVFAPRPRCGPHKLRESLPLILFLRNRLKYALTYREAKLICKQRLIKVDGKVRTDMRFPAGFMDVIRIDKTNETFRLLYDAKGRYATHRITGAEGNFKLCKVVKKAVGPKGVPFIVTHDARTIRYPDPHIKVNDTVIIDISTGKVTDYVKFDQGNLCMVTGGHNMGRVGIVGHREKHPGSFDIIHIKDIAGHSFATRLSNVFIIGKGTTALVSLPGPTKVLNGIICVHIPAVEGLNYVKKRIVEAICEGGNRSIPEIRLPVINMPVVEAHHKSQALIVVGWKKQSDYSLHPLVIGEPFRAEDIQIEELHNTGNFSSGVGIFGVNNGCDQFDDILSYGWLNEYDIRIKLGHSTTDGSNLSPVKETCDFKLLYILDHVTRHKIEELLSIIETRYKKLSFELANVDLQSQEAFELSRKGPLRQRILKAPMIYSIVLNSFNPPEFTLTLTSIGETETFFFDFVREIGLNLGIFMFNHSTFATCCGIKRRRAGPFDDRHSLLIKHLSVRNIMLNMARSHKLIDYYRKNVNSNVIQKMDEINIDEISENQLTEVLGDLQEAEVDENCIQMSFDREYTTINNFLVIFSKFFLKTECYSFRNFISIFLILIY